MILLNPTNMKHHQKLYEVKVEKNIDKISQKPYKFTITIQYTDKTFQARMKNVLESSPIVLCIQERGIFNSLITRSKQKVFFDNWKDIEELNRNLLRIPVETIRFKCEKNTFYYKERKEGEEEICLIEQTVREFLEKESKVYESIGFNGI